MFQSVEAVPKGGVARGVLAKGMTRKGKGSMSGGTIRSTLAALAAAVLGCLALAGQAQANGAVPIPNVTGPVAVTADSYPFLATDIDLSRYGYVEEEFFLTGRAYRYDTSGSPRPVDQTATRIETGGTQGDGS